jgi:magnesium transporter
MIYAFVPRNGTVDRLEIAGHIPIPDNALWYDLFEPTPDERLRVDAALGLQLPSREEMAEIEPSSRLYTEGDVIYMTATIMAQADTPFPVAEPFTFVLTRRYLVTIRYQNPRPVASYCQRLMRGGASRTAQDVLIGLFEAFVDRIADVLEKVALDLDAQARTIFTANAAVAEGRGATAELQAVVRALGLNEDLATSARESILSLNRVLSFLVTALENAIPPDGSRKEFKDQRTRIKSLGRDMASLSEHASFELAKVNFLLDATLGVINIEQTRIIKLFSVAAVMFLPPTLVASVYGMNFQHMPELEWSLGYPLAIVIMVLSAVGPYLYFKRKGWF